MVVDGAEEVVADFSVRGKGLDDDSGKIILEEEN